MTRVVRTEGPLLLQHAVSEIREAIVSGRMQPGQRLVELDLADELGLSRGPVREALRQLSREGLVTMRPNRGAIVRSVAAEDVIEVYALRAALGTLALRNLMGSGRATQSFIDQLEAAAKGARAARTSQTRLVEADLAFQAMIPERSGLPRVAARFAELTAEVRMFIQVLGIRYRDVGRILSEHDQLLAAIRSGDAVVAEAVWRGRFARAEREFVDLIPDGVSALSRLPWLALNDGVVHGETVSLASQTVPRSVAPGSVVPD